MDPHMKSNLSQMKVYSRCPSCGPVPHGEQAAVEKMDKSANRSGVMKI